MNKQNLTWLAVFGLVALMFVRLPPMVAKEDSVLSTYRTLVEVDALAKQQFVEPIDDDRLVDGAIRGMMLGLDRYSGYISPDELPRFEKRQLGEYVGLGLDIGISAGRATVIAAVEGGPAANASVYAGDGIIEIDGHDTDGLSILDMERLLDGEAGTAVLLTVAHAGRAEPERISLTRRPVSLHTVAGFRRTVAGSWDFMLDPTARIGYIRISSFRKDTMRAFDAALHELSEQDVRGVILDLRFNPGGLMEQAVALVDRFVESGTIVATVTRRLAVSRYSATAPGTWSDTELAVVVNGSTASAAEIVAGSLQEHRRAVVVGERTFGKASVQRLMRLTSSDAAVTLTVAYYRLPSGRLIHRMPSAGDDHAQRWGVLPDVEVTLTGEETQAIQASHRLLDSQRTNQPAPKNESAAVANISRVLPAPEIIRDRQLIKALSIIEMQLVPSAAGTP